MTRKASKAKLLETLANDWGADSVEDLLKLATLDSVAPGICPVCEYTTEVEPDQDRGWCEVCDKGTVQSCLVLAGLI